MATDSSAAPGRRIVAATDGGPDGTRAVRAAARETTRRGAVLHVVHVIPGYLQGAPYPMIDDGSLERRGRQVLAAAVEAAREVVPAVTTTTTLTAGRRVTCIADEGDGADLVVVAARDLSLVARVWTGSTTAGVTARATCPVLVLPASYEEGRPMADRVTVGVKDPRHADNVLATGFAEAEARGAKLLALHAWCLSSGYDDLITGRVADPDWEKLVTSPLDEALAGQYRAHPDVAAERRATHGQPARVLVDASRECDRLVVGKPLHGGAVHHLGGTLRALLRESTCPVLVVPQEVRASSGPRQDGHLG